MSMKELLFVIMCEWSPLYEDASFLLNYFAPECKSKRFDGEYHLHHDIEKIVYEKYSLHSFVHKILILLSNCV